MKTLLKISFFALFILGCNNSQPEKHLFILSGQSNMAGLDLTTSFIPTIETKFGKENVTFVKHAIGGRPIRQWFVDSLVGTEQRPRLYDSLMVRVRDSIKGKIFASISFFWMQGERDAREQLGHIYKANLMGLYNQLSSDLNRDDINFIIGRLSDFDMQNERYKDWTKIRAIQLEIANSNVRFEWINTDDLNDGLNKRGDTISNDLHMSVEGYKTMGQRFADKAITLIERHP